MMLHSVILLIITMVVGIYVAIAISLYQEYKDDATHKERLMFKIVLWPILLIEALVCHNYIQHFKPLITKIYYKTIKRRQLKELEKKVYLYKKLT